ncbi:hypothetical protein CYMTET_39885 [Cymbomonas tetramitiformis]|uniref:Uncharacterized protein n=1 Tax=Cymbomonas tetramitiformis TaxID=36881 RepID=A0AAE0F3J0_9CHLO|nr:hypothetical protein CYMTET_39885 [Cymbomonas tetramitiformis]
MAARLLDGLVDVRGFPTRAECLELASGGAVGAAETQSAEMSAGASGPGQSVSRVQDILDKCVAGLLEEAVGGEGTGGGVVGVERGAGGGEGDGVGTSRAPQSSGTRDPGSGGHLQ